MQDVDTRVTSLLLVATVHKDSCLVYVECQKEFHFVPNVTVIASSLVCYSMQVHQDKAVHDTAQPYTAADLWLLLTHSTRLSLYNAEDLT
jgi:hypothetical protein